jgi:hypothetical protein
MTTKHKLPTRPGPGWRHVAGAVWDHDSGIRLHLLGTARMPSGVWRRASEWPASGLADDCIRICGGNRKRGLMVWALVLSEITVEAYPCLRPDNGVPLRVFVRDPKGGAPDEWPADLRVREFPAPSDE